MHRLALLSIRFPLGMLVALAVVTVWFGMGMTRLRTEAGFRSYLGADHPSVRRLDRFVERFGGGLPAAIVWSCEPGGCDSVFDDVSLEIARTLTRSLSELPGVRRVGGLASSPLIAPVDDGIAVRHFVEDGELAPDREELARLAQEDPFWRGRLVSKDGRVAAVVVELSSSDTVVTSTVVEAMREQADDLLRRGITAHLVGDPVTFVLAAQDLESDARRLVPLMMLLIGLIVYLVFRSFVETLIVLACVTLPLVWTFGTAGWLGWPRTAVSQALGPFILVIGVCDTIHFLSRYHEQRSGHGGQARANVEPAARQLALPCLFTSLTTAGGFLSFTASPIESLDRFGALAAVGVGYALLVSFSFLPACLVLTPLHSHKVEGEPDAWPRAIDVVLRNVRRRPGLVLGIGVALTAIGIYGLPKLRADASIYEIFGEDSRVARGLRFSQEHLSGAGALEIELDAPGMSLYEDATFRQLVRDTATFLESVGHVQNSRSVLSVTAHLSELLGAEGASGTDRDAELLFLLSLGHGDLLDDWLSLDGRRVRISAEVEQTSVSRAGVIIERVEEYLRGRTPRGITHTVTGSFPLEYELMTQVQDVQLRSFGIAWIVIGSLLALFLRSARLAALGMIVTTVPVIATLGAMGLWGINLDIGTAMVGAVVLGIAVDDTIHVLSRYRIARVAGAGRWESIRTAVLHVGRAVVTTSVALVLGFFTMTTSSWESVANFGVLSGIAIAAALAADLVLLPALVAVFERRRSRP